MMTSLFPTKDGSLLWISAEAGTICSDFHEKLDVLFEVKGSGLGARLKPIYQGDADFEPTLLLDLDGSPALLGVESALRKTPAGFEIHALSVPFLDCPC